MTTPRRRWSFSLRTLFVAVTVVACWLGPELHAIRERTKAKEWIMVHDGTWNSWVDPIMGVFLSEESPQLKALARRFSTTRWLLSDEQVIYIAFPKGKATDADRARLQRLFPEALVLEVDSETLSATQADRP